MLTIYKRSQFLTLHAKSKWWEVSAHLIVFSKFSYYCHINTHRRKFASAAVLRTLSHLQKTAADDVSRR